MQLFLDMDGVLADFDKRALEILGMKPSIFEERYGSEAFWIILQNTPDFYNSFDMMIDAPFLLEAVKHLDPIILTGVPATKMELAVANKRVWAGRMIGLVPVITCRSRDKSNWCLPGDVIVDDRTEYRHLWEQKGGIWVTHTSAWNSIKELKSLGVI